jgi:hypothetical protein
MEWGGSAGEEGAIIVDNEEDIEGDERREFSPQQSRSHSPTRGHPQSRSPTPTHHRTAQTSPKRGRGRDRRGPPQYREPPPEIVESDNSDPDDDYETTQKAKEHEFERNKRFHPSATRTEDEDEEDEEDFLEQVRQGEIQSEDETRARKKAKKQGGKKGVRSKGKSKVAPGDSDVDETRRSGPFSKELKKEADELGAEFKKNVAALAQKYRKDPQAVHRYLGSLTKAHREKNAWNLYQSWKSAPDGGNDVMPDDSKLCKSLPHLHDLIAFASGTPGVERQGGRRL